MYAILDELTNPTVVDNTDTADEDNLDHFYCDCDENRSLCGRDLTFVEETEIDKNSSDMCVMCLEMDELPCPKCGWAPQE